MKLRDREALQRPYSAGETLAKAVDVLLPAVENLSKEVAADLDTSVHGVRWWAGQIDAASLTLISDHLVQCLSSVFTNLMEARLHLLEVQDSCEQGEAFLAQAVTYGPDGRPSLPRYPPRPRPADDLPATMTDLHIAGFFRAVNSALDCLGAVVIGVMGLSVPILTASFKEARSGLLTIKPTDDGSRFLAAFSRVLEQLVVSAGPPDWLPWVDQMRNMLIHRARRFHMVSWEPRGPYGNLVGPDGNRVRMAWPVRHLPREPALSDALALSPGSEMPVLGEDMDKTLRGVMGSALVFCDNLAGELVRAWVQRRQRPGLLRQPPGQWPLLKPASRSAFPGYDAKAKPFRPDILLTSPETIERFVVTGIGRRAT